MERYILEESLKNKFLESRNAINTLKLYTNVACLDEYKLLNQKTRGSRNSASVYDQVRALEADDKLELTETYRGRRLCENLIAQLPRSMPISMNDRDVHWSVHWEEVVQGEGSPATRVPIMLIREGQIKDLIEGCIFTVSTLQGHALFSLPVNTDLISPLAREACLKALQTIAAFCDALEEFLGSCEEDGSKASTVGATSHPTYEDTAFRPRMSRLKVITTRLASRLAQDIQPPSQPSSEGQQTWTLLCLNHPALPSRSLSSKSLGNCLERKKVNTMSVVLY